MFYNFTSSGKVRLYEFINARFDANANINKFLYVHKTVNKIINAQLNILIHYL
jgi:hypothetical protein